MEAKEMICIVCPVGCRLTVEKDDKSEKGYKVTGNKCKRGENYGIKELTNPTRPIITTVKINNSYLNRLPVRSKGEVPKAKIFDCMKAINEVEVDSPIKMGDIIIKDILNTGVDIVASRSL